MNKMHPTHVHTHTLYIISTRHFAKHGIHRGRKRKLRWFKPGLPLGDKPRPDTSKTRTLTASPWGPPRYPIPRVQHTSVEFAQNLNSLSHIIQSKLQCLALTVSSYNHASKAALERMNNYALDISQSSPYLYLYQLIIVDDILGYSRDFGSRNTLWIPSDFTVKELIQYLKNECINDPKLCETRRIDNYLNPFQPNNWTSIDRLSDLDGSLNGSQSVMRRVPFTEYREVEPVELLKIREKARNTTWRDEHYTDTTDFFNYWSVPNKETMNKAHGTDDSVPEYTIKEQSMEDEIETDSYLQQIDAMEEKLNHKLLERKQWYLDQMETYKSDQKKAEDQDEEEENKVNTLLSEELEIDDDNTILYEVNRHKTDVGQHVTIQMELAQEDESQKVDSEQEDNNLCSIHFRQKKVKRSRIKKH